MSSQINASVIRSSKFPCAEVSPHPHLLRQSAGFITRILRVMGISTAAWDDLGLGGPGLTASTQQLLDILQAFKSSVAQHKELEQVKPHILFKQHTIAITG